MELCLQFSESDIEHWAARYVDCQPLSARQCEQTLIDRKQSIGRAKCMTLNELYDLAVWKSRRQSKRVWNNKSVVESITRDAFSSTDDWKKIQIFRVASQRECEALNVFPSSYHIQKADVLVLMFYAYSAA